MKPTAIDVFAMLPPGVQDEMINDLFSKVGASVVGKLAATDNASFGEWLGGLYDGGETSAEPSLRFGPPECPNCGSDGSFTECATCGGESYFVSADNSVCKNCGIKQVTIYPTAQPAVSTDSEAPF